MYRRLLTATLVTAALLPAPRAAFAAEQLYPRHVTKRSADAVQKGLAYLAKNQTADGNWVNQQDGSAYPISMAALAGMAFLANGNTPHRGPYAENVARTVQYLLANTQANGLITGPTQEGGRPMYGHGFGMMFLASCYGMETDDRTRKAMRRAIENAITLTARGQSNLGGWTYTPGGGDEGSVTVTQIQGLRAAQNAGFTVPKGTITEAIRYLERCRQPDGGISYAFGHAGSRPAITCAALATLYNAGEYESKLSEGLLEYVTKMFDTNKGNFNVTGHDFYTHLYASQAIYQTGDKNWDNYFPPARDMILKQQAADGSWEGDGVGPIYGTSVACVMLQLPYKFMPIYQR